MPSPSSKISGSSSSGNALADLSDAVIAAIETGIASGFDSVAQQSATGSAVGAAPGAAAAPVSSIVEPPGGIAPPPANPHALGAYEAAQAQKDEIEAHLKNEYAERGKFGAVGGEEYKDKLSEHLENAGFGSGEESEKGRVKSLGQFGRRLKSGLWEEEAGLGFPALELAEGVSKRINKLDSGEYVAPEERQASLTEAVAPGVGGIFGAAAGTAFGNPVLGSFLGAGAGEIVAATVGAKSEKDESTREAAEKLVAAMSLTEDAFHSLRSQIEQSGAPVKQISEGLNILESTGAIGSGSGVVAGQARLALGLGEQFAPVDTVIAQTLSADPALYQASAAFHTKGDMSSGDYRDVAKLELLQGNPGAYTAFQQASAAERDESDPETKKAINNQKGVEGSWFDETLHGISSLKKSLRPHLGPFGFILDPLGLPLRDVDPVEDAQKQTEDARGKAGDKAKEQAADDYKDSLERGAANLSLLSSGSAVNRQVGEYRYAALGSETPQQLARRLPALETALGQEAAADQTMIEQDNKELSKLPANSPARAAYQLEISKLEDDKIEKPNLFYRKFVKENYISQIQETSAVSSLIETRATIEGRSAADIQKQVNKQATYLENMATSPKNPLDPTEITSLQEQAVKMRYAAKIETQAQNLSKQDERIEQADLGIVKAQINGGPEEVYKARDQEVSDFQSKIKELVETLSQGGLSVDDRIAKERELTSAREASVKAVDAQGQGRLNDNFAIDATREETAQIGLGRRISRTGNAGAGESALSLSLTEIADAQSHLDFDRAHSPKNLKRIADDEDRVSQTREQREQLLDETNDYNPGGAFNRKLANDRANFQISLENPYQDGDPNADPMTRGRTVLADLNTDVAGLKKNRSALMQSGKWREEDETRYTGQLNSDRLQISQIEQQQRIGYESLIPEMLAGSPGQGRLTGILPTAGQAAYFNPNQFITGTFGKPSPRQIDDGEGHPAMAGGQVGAFLKASGVAGAAAHAATAMGGDSGPAILAELQRLNANIERANNRGTRSPVMTSGSTGGVSPYEFGGGGR